MPKTLLVPDHIAKQRNEEKKESSVPYISKEDRVLDPNLVNKSLKERLPQPTGWRLLVMPYQGKAKTEGGIIIPNEAREREALATVVAYVLKLGPLAYQDPNKFGDNPEPWCQEGQWVCIGRYAGSRFKIEGGEVRIINDDEVIATILEPEDVKQV